MLWWMRWVRRNALVNLKDGTAVQGVLYRASTRHGAELHQASILTPGQDPVRAEGVVIVTAANIALIQFPPGV